MQIFIILFFLKALTSLLYSREPYILFKYLIGLFLWIYPHVGVQFHRYMIFFEYVRRYILYIYVLRTLYSDRESNIKLYWPVGILSKRRIVVKYIPLYIKKYIELRRNWTLKIRLCRSTTEPSVNLTLKACIENND